MTSLLKSHVCQFLYTFCWTHFRDTFAGALILHTKISETVMMNETECQNVLPGLKRK